MVGASVVARRAQATGTVLPRDFYAQPTLQVAEGLLGKVLVHRTDAGVAAGMIVETEAYIGEDDPACHAAPGPTLRNAPLYGRPGVAYGGIPLMRRRRTPTGREVDLTDLCRGPGNLTRALGITLAENRLDLTRSALTIEDHGYRVEKVAWTPRIGIRVAVDRPWRCAVAGNPCVSGRRNRA
jgi:DNA-3-methyladenine glycosylase